MSKLPILYQNPIYLKGHTDGYQLAKSEDNNAVRLYRDPFMSLVLKSQDILGQIRAVIQFMRGEDRAVKLAELRVKFNESTTNIDNHILVMLKSGYFADMSKQQNYLRELFSKVNDMLVDAISNPDKAAEISLEYGFNFPEIKMTGRPSDPVTTYLAEQAIGFNPNGKAWSLAAQQIIHALKRISKRSFIEQSALDMLEYQGARAGDYLKGVVKEHRRKLKKWGVEKV